MNKEPPYTNRLIHEKSPYLLQHAHNPVDWFPWGDEAFAAAMENDKPIFLSIGYATCHWCHTMEKESFENLEVAKKMNDAFVNIKLDREELPEIDNLYMEFAQSMMAGAAGWPLNVILTPALRPFFAATYLPPFSSEGMMGMMDLISRIQEVWHGDERERIEAQAHKIVEVFADSAVTSGELIPQRNVIEETAELLFKMADPIYGGMKGTPKFPIGYQYKFMLLYASAKNDSRGLFLVEKTLDMMQRGGIYDHFGGGFSRYSVDEKWLVPHFEKMLYDNAILACSYVEAWQITKKNLYREIATDILEYVLRDMTHPEGGFYSAEDADSEGVEGLFYTWTFDEVEKLLSKEDARLACDFFDIQPEATFEGRNIVHTELRANEFAEQKGMDCDELKDRLQEIRQKLWEARKQRVHPLKDDKILSSWNGLMIHAMAKAACVFQERRYLEAAVKAARFIKDKMWKEGRLLRRWREGEAMFNAGLDEYAFLIRGLITLFEAGEGEEWLLWAIEMTKILQNDFKAENGAYYQTDGSNPSVILRRCQFSDGAEPSGNAIHGENLLRLYQITFDSQYREQAEDIFRAVHSFLETYSPGYCYHIINLNRYYDPKSPTVVISLDKSLSHKDELHRMIYEGYIPNLAVIWLSEEEEGLRKALPTMADYPLKDGKTTLYLCHDKTCREPLTDIEAIQQVISKL